MTTSSKESKQKYYQKVYEQASWIECAVVVEQTSRIEINMVDLENISVVTIL